MRDGAQPHPADLVDKVASAQGDINISAVRGLLRRLYDGWSGSLAEQVRWLEELRVGKAVLGPRVSPFTAAGREDPAIGQQQCDGVVATVGTFLGHRSP